MNNSTMNIAFDVIAIAFMAYGGFTLTKKLWTLNDEHKCKCDCCVK